MNTSLKIVSLVLAASLAGSFGAELSGLLVPAPIDPIHLFSALVGALVLLSLCSEYGAKRTPLGATASSRTIPFVKSAHPLAA